MNLAYIILVLILIAAVIGIAGIWMPSTSRIGWRLFLTDMAILVACIGAAITMKYLR